MTAGKTIEAPPSPPTHLPPHRERHPKRRVRVALVLSTIVVVGAVLIAAGVLGAGRSPSGSSAPAESTTIASGTPATPAVVPANVTGVDVSDVAAQVVDSVVTVNVAIDLRGPRDLTGSGSGIIIDAGGTVVTNAHVVANATTVTATLSDGTTVDAAVVDIDTVHDLAVISIDASGLSPVIFGTTEGLEVGDPVIAVGNPLGLQGGPSVTTGIVSALGRVIDEGDVSLADVIQTDAAITEGSSGGALFDIQGRLIGVTTAVGVSSVGVEGIGFAIPIETVSAVVATLTS